MGVVIESYALPRGSPPRMARVPQFNLPATTGHPSAHARPKANSQPLRVIFVTRVTQGGRNSARTTGLLMPLAAVLVKSMRCVIVRRRRDGELSHGGGRLAG